VVRGAVVVYRSPDASPNRVGRVDAIELRALLAQVADGSTDIETATALLGDAPLQGFTDLGFARLDAHRAIRTGDPEVVYAAGKTVEQVIVLLRELAAAPGRRPAIATRLTEAMATTLRAEFPDGWLDESAGCIGCRGVGRNQRRAGSG
jgi:hypothetical protein